MDGMTHEQNCHFIGAFGRMLGSEYNMRKFHRIAKRMYRENEEFREMVEAYALQPKITTPLKDTNNMMRIFEEVMAAELADARRKYGVEP